MASGYVAFTLSFQREGDQWVGECLETSTSTFAESLEDCQEELRELVIDHLDILEEVGERELSFQEWGITIHPTDDVLTELTFPVSADARGRLFQPLLVSLNLQDRRATHATAP